MARFQRKKALTAKRADGASPHAGTRQGTGAAPGDAAKGKNRHPGRLPGHGGPSGGAKAGGTRVAGGGKYGGQKNHLRTGAASAMHIRQTMGGTGDKTPLARFPRLWAGPAPGTQMAARFQGMGETDIPGDHEHQATGTADAGQGLADGGPIRRIVVAKHDPTQVFRKPGRRGQRVPATGCVREQP